MLQIPIQPVSNQRLAVVLAGQTCQLYIYTKPQGMFVDINADGVNVSLGVIARDGVPLNACDYSTFQGNFYFVDTQGSSDPAPSGLGSRYQLVYVTADEYALIR